MASVSFLAVYRELFEIILFYKALWAQAGDAGHDFVLGGVGVAMALLALIGWGVFEYGLRLPLSRFFSATSVLLAVLAVVFVGQGVSALQEAGAVGVRAVAFIRVPELGIFPTAQTLTAQVAVALILIGSFSLVGRQRMEPAETIDTD
jgi:high-affinity iron transporter